MIQRECDKCSLSRCCCCGCRRRCCRYTDEMKNRQRQQLIAYNMQYVCRSCVCLVYNAAATMTARQYIALRVETVTHSFMNFLFHKIHNKCTIHIQTAMPWWHNERRLHLCVVIVAVCSRKTIIYYVTSNKLHTSTATYDQIVIVEH